MYKRSIIYLVVFLLLASVGSGEFVSSVNGEELIAGGDFEDAVQSEIPGWNDFWARSGEGNATAISLGENDAAVKIEYRGEEDWSFNQSRPLKVVAGEIYELSARIKIEGPGTATLCVTLFDDEDRALDWSFGGRTMTADVKWEEVRSRFIVPEGTCTMQPRLIGRKNSTVLVDDVSLRRTGSLRELRETDLPPEVTVSTDFLKVTWNTQNGRWSLLDRRSGRRWCSAETSRVFVLAAESRRNRLEMKLLKPDDLLTLHCRVMLEPSSPEFTVTLEGDGEMGHDFAFPPALATKPGDYLIMPVNEGISYPVDDETIDPMRYHLFGGHGLCMAWYGVTDLEQALMTIVESPDDAVVRTPRQNDRLTLAPQWLSQKGVFGPARRIRYVSFSEGGYVAMCKRYRRHAKEMGLFKTLAEKREENPNVDLLVGAVNIWRMGGPGRPAPQWIEILREHGIDRILWSKSESPEELHRLNAMGVLTSRYDIYQDAMNPEHFDRLPYIHSGWTSEAWANDHLMIDRHGDWVRGWRVKAKDGEMIPCGVLCDSRAVEYAHRRVPEELKTHPYRCRFIDTTTASSWRECHHPEHPMTRSASKHHKMDLLRYMSESCGLVTGSETGHEAAVPYVHYFEGMMSLGPYRIPEAGRNMLEPVDDPSERFEKFQTGHYYRLPLWELVYHDCIVAYWYWGDYNNKMPGLWDRRDLINVLYGTPPMFMFDQKIWEEHAERFSRSYRTIEPVARACGYSEMLDHRWLTDDHAVQQTTFDNGTVVTVNFGANDYRIPGGLPIPAMSHRVEGLPSSNK